LEVPRKIAFAIILTFMAEERQSGVAPGLAGQMGHKQSLGLFRRVGDDGATRPRQRKRNRVIFLRVCCSVCHGEGFGSASDRVRLTCRHFLHRKCLEDLVRHCSKESGPRCPLCRRDIEEERADQRDKFNITKVVGHKFELAGRYFVDKYLCVWHEPGVPTWEPSSLVSEYLRTELPKRHT